MNRPRVTIAGMMTVVLILGVGFAALRYSTIYWASGVFTLVVLLLSVATLGSIACRGRARATWAGFAVFGWIYFGTTFIAWPNSNGVTAPPYLTQALLESHPPAASDEKVLIYDSAPTGIRFSETPTFVGFTGRVINLLHFRCIGHSLAAVLFGLVGAALGRFFATRTQPEA
jgi:hypothetical protein